ncbi:MAG: Na+/H+ antiporter subunit E [Pseudomonadales bacterium]
MKWAALFAVLLGLWLLWSGLYKPLIISFGVMSCLACVWITLRMHPVDEPAQSRVSLTRLVAYQPWLLKEIALANWDVIRIVMTPGLNIHPVLLTLTGSQRSHLGRVIYGNSITLTPGTLTMDIDGDRLTVHALTREGAGQLESGQMNARVARLEDAV